LRERDGRAACGQRIADSRSHVLISMDGYYRSGQVVDHKEKVDQPVEEAQKEGQAVEKVLVWRGTMASTCRRRRWSTAATSLRRTY
jgi:acyl-coenzyme A synthetase/AMP-(fatty) acid ligase